MKQLLREPLVHFLALGAALFIWNGVGGNGAGAQNQIVVTAGQVDRLIEGWTRTWQRPPTPQEVDGMIEDYVREEVLYREAMEMGLDEDGRGRGRERADTSQVVAVVVADDDSPGGP